MTDDILTRVSAADPLRDEPPVAPDPALRERIVMTRRPSAQRATRTRHRPRRLAIALVAAGIAVPVGAALMISGGASVDVATRAYAQTASSDAIVHSVERTVSIVPGALRGGRTETRLERWLHGPESRTLITVGQDGREETYDQVLGADGVLRNHLSDGDVQVVRPDDGRDAQATLAQARESAVARFRRQYEAGTLREAGTAAFAGRTARLYVREADESFPPDAGHRGAPARQHTREVFYLDASTAEPLGVRVEISNDAATYVQQTTIESYERLDVTPANLERLRR